MDFDKVCDDQPDRGTAISGEWELNTANKIKNRDSALHELLTKSKYNLPTISPNGNYSPSNNQNKTSIKAIDLPLKFIKKPADKITNFNPSTDILEIDADSFGIDSSATFTIGKNKKK